MTQGPRTGPPEERQPPPPGTQPPLGGKLSGCFTVAVTLVGILVVAGIIGALPGEDAPKSTPSARPSASNARPPPLMAASTATPPTTTPPRATKPMPIPVEQQLKEAVLKAVGDSNRNLDPLPEFSAPRGEYIVLTWTIDENLTEGLTKDGACRDGIRILKAIKKVEARTGNHYTGVLLKGSYLLVDKYGHESEEVVVRAGYHKATISRINFDNVSFKDIFHLADRGSVHPAFQY